MPEKRSNSVIYGDLHGDIVSLARIKEMEGMEKPCARASGHEFLELLDEFAGTSRNSRKTVVMDRIPQQLYLGDYTDRGNHPVEVISAVVSDYLNSPEDVVMLAGNHDDGFWNSERGRVEIELQPFDLEHKVIGAYGGAQGREIMKAIAQKFWPRLPCSCLVEGMYWFVHGGVPVGRTETGTYARRLNVENPGKQEIFEMLWNDPVNQENNMGNYRGYGVRSYGYVASQEILDSIGAKAIIRSHEPVKVLESSQGGRVLTIGSCPNSYGDMKEGSYLSIAPDDAVEGADGLMRRSARRFPGSKASF